MPLISEADTEMPNLSPPNAEIPLGRKSQSAHVTTDSICFRVPVRPAGRLVFVFLFWLIGSLNKTTAADLTKATNSFRTGDYQAALDATSNGIEESYRREDWWLLRMRSQMALGRYSEALQALDDSLKRSPNSIRLRWLGRDVARFNGNDERATELVDEIGQLIRSQSWRYRVSGLDLVTVGHFEIALGIDPKDVLDGVWTSAQRSSAGRVPALLACGELALAKEDFALAAEYFQKAVRYADDEPDVHAGLANAFAATDPEAANAALEKALELNPLHVQSLLRVADRQIDSENYLAADLTLKKVLKVNSLHPIALAYQAVLAHLNNELDAEEQLVDTALSTWKNNPFVPHIVGQKLSRKYRFDEGAEYQRQALNFDPQFMAARIQLSQDLLRLGEEDEAWRLAEQVAETDPYNVLAYNLSTLQDQLEKFVVLKSGRFRVRMDRTEASLYGDRVLALLAEAEADIAERYKATLSDEVFVDIYHNQRDFAIRTFGLPGGAGFLGVCFGNVITMNSPAALGRQQTNWESVLWHEFTHVVTLTKTLNKMPRWLSEGISVYEERARDKRWGQSMTPEFRQMVLGDDLTPISQLSGAFLSPPSGTHLQFAYYESSLAIDYIVEEFGFEALTSVLEELARGLTINDALTRHTTDIAALDSAFAEYVRRLASAYAPDADFSEIELPANAAVDVIETALAVTPNNVPALMRLATLQLDKSPQSAIDTLDRVKQLFGDAKPPAAILRLTAQAHDKLANDAQKKQLLLELTENESAALDAIRPLMADAVAEEDWPNVVRYANDFLAVNPLVKPPHEALAAAAAAQDHAAAEVSAWQALAVLGASDIAGVNYRIANRCFELGRIDDSKRHTLIALEEAPRYIDAHRLLLKIVELEREEMTSSADEETSPTTPPAPNVNDKQQKPQAIAF